jgi:sec-independent protein translocase protein TatC
MSEEREMNFFDHIEELRWHLFRSVIFLIVATILVFFFSSFIFNEIIFGPLSPDFWSYRVLCSVMKDFCIDNVPVKLLNTEIAGQFSLHLKTAFILGFMLSIPYFLWEIWRFIKPALHPSERNYSQILLGCGFFLFIIGSCLGYFVIFPITLLFLTGYQVSNTIENMYSISNYYDYLTDSVLWTGAIFELPILFYFLAKMGFVSSEFLSTYRRHLYLVLLVVAAGITPSPDITSMMMVACPLFILYEISAIVVSQVEKFEKNNLKK